MSGKKPLTLSIVIPVYNEERYLKSCLDSIARQTVMPSQVFVVDNNSTDKSLKIAKKYSFVTVLKEPRQGIVYARNTGFNASITDLIGRIDADTVLAADWCEKVLEDYHRHAPKSGLYVATGPSSFRNVFGSLIWYPLHRVFYFWASRVMLGHSTLSGSNMYITAKLWKKIKNEVCLRTDIHEDMDLAIHVHRQGILIHFIHGPKDSMLNRHFVHKFKYYIPMFIKVRFIEH